MKGHTNRVAVVAGMRTPFVKAGSHFLVIDQLELSRHAVRGLLGKTGIDPQQIDELVWGRVLHDPRIPNLIRIVVTNHPVHSDQ